MICFGLYSSFPATASAEGRQFNGAPFPATASAEGRHIKGGPFPATASAEGRQFNGAPSPETLEPVYRSLHDMSCGASSRQMRRGTR